MIPVRVSPLFFLTAALIGFLWSNTLMGTLIWMMIIFVSVLVHEYGHALTAKAFGQSPRIELVAFGGLTIPQGKRLSLGKEFLVVLMGPAFGFLLFLTAYLIEPYTESFMQMILRFTWIVNLFWTAINLLPILPFDGGLFSLICLSEL